MTYYSPTLNFQNLEKTSIARGKQKAGHINLQIVVNIAFYGS